MLETSLGFPMYLQGQLSRNIRVITLAGGGQRGPGRAERHCPRQLPEAAELESFLSPSPYYGPEWASTGLGCALWSAHAVQRLSHGPRRRGSA